jgi:FdhE protein
MTAPDAALNHLKRQRPEWQPWLVVVEEIVRETGTPVWDAAVPADAPARSSAGSNAGSSPGSNTVPLLAGATLALPMRSVHRLWERLIRIASRTGMPKMATLQSALHADGDTLSLLTAALCQDHDRLTDRAARSGADAEALHAVAALLPVPFLHACTRRWASALSDSWVEPYCPVCGAWPAFAEVRGIERSRSFRCGRCSAAWHARALWCPYCGTSDHDDLVALVPGKSGTNAVIDACTRCLGYVKTLTRLHGCPPGTVMLEDLASVDLDVAALDHGYRRPAGAGYTLTMTVTDTGATRRLFSWRS